MNRSIAGQQWPWLFNFPTHLSKLSLFLINSSSFSLAYSTTSLWSSTPWFTPNGPAEEGGKKRILLISYSFKKDNRLLKTELQSKPLLQELFVHLPDLWDRAKKTSVKSASHQWSGPPLCSGILSRCPDWGRRVLAAASAPPWPRNRCTVQKGGCCRASRPSPCRRFLCIHPSSNPHDLSPWTPAPPYLFWCTAPPSGCRSDRHCPRRRSRLRPWSSSRHKRGKKKEQTRRGSQRWPLFTSSTSYNRIDGWLDGWTDDLDPFRRSLDNLHMSTGSKDKNKEKKHKIFWHNFSSS